MKPTRWLLLSSLAAATLAIGQTVPPPPPDQLSIADSPLFVESTTPPLNMLVMGKDHKIYYEAYNDASDLDGDGSLDVGYKPATIDYYGYFNSNVCYTYQSNNGGRFTPSSAATNKQCSGKWSGDFLNYLTTSRMDALRRVLYGGWRQVDDVGNTTLQGAFFPQDAHSWGKEYQSIERDGYDISNYAPLTEPDEDNYHLFAVTTVTGNDATYASGYAAPLFRVLKNTEARVWNWLSIEGPVAGNYCFNASNERYPCRGGSSAFPGHPGNRNAFDTMESNYAIPDNISGSGNVNTIDCKDDDCNPDGSDSNYLTIIEGEINIRNGRGGTYQFRVDGDDVIDFTLYAPDGTQLVSPACYDSDGRGFGACSGNETSTSVSLNGNTSYGFKFRHEEAEGGDGYLLEWRKTSGSNQFDWRPITTNASGDAEGNGDLTDATTRATYDLTPFVPSVDSADYNVRVQVCPDTVALQDDTCKAYEDHFKPTGILHDYGENQKMFFGLITGSQFNNLEGGVLRKNISNFAGEINPETGQFLDGVGIVNTLDSLRMIGGGYAGDTTNNLNNDSNWNWANGYGNCPSVGGRAIANGECRMWGNPIAEMMFEGMRYFAGAAVATARFATGGADEGRTEETAMGLSQATWQDPYATDGGGYASCARPFETVISDINPSYDGGLPGSAFTTVAGDATVSGFDAAAQGQAIWNHEFGGARNVFIGEVAGVTDGAPTAKTASSFGNIRGLSPEEPTKGGTYYAASVARYGFVNDLNATAANDQQLGVYAVALASPLPRIAIPMGEGVVTLLPFAKTVSGTFGGGTRKPVNTIVDFYVEKIVNLPGGVQDPNVNGGRPSAVFRINYEDVEQGNDHDMDAIVRYEVLANDDGTLTVNLTSQYAAGSANQNIGYVLSGTTEDGIYLEVRDVDAPTYPYEDRDGNRPGGGAYRMGYRAYDFNTPPNRDPGYCEGNTSTECGLLPKTASRVFTPSTSAALATELHNPLWYAAKYGGFKDANDNDLPDAGEWDAKAAGKPDNYFLVTNPLNLREQLSEAFDAIQSQADQPSGSLSVSGARLGAGSFTVTPSFSALSEGKDWVGELRAFRVNAIGSAGGQLWAASGLMPDTAAGVFDRKIYTSLEAVDSGNRAIAVVEFRAENLGGDPTAQANSIGYTLSDITDLFGGSTTPNQLVNYLRGEDTLEGGVIGVTPFRERSGILGDIINSVPVVATAKDNNGWASASGLSQTIREAYDDPASESDYFGSSGKGDRDTYVYVGANDGMLHAFDGSTTLCELTDGTPSVCATANSGKEVFAYVPNSVLDHMGELADPDYQHRYYVDGSLVVSDVHDGTNWTTVLVGGAGAGGKGAFGLDVSNPSGFSASDVLWEVNGDTAVIGADIGYVMGEPTIVPLEDGSWVTLFGNGYNSTNGKSALVIVDVMTGSASTLVADDGVNTANGMGNIAAIDTNGNGLVDTVYGGDLHGNVWKFDFSAATPVVAFSGSPLFVATDSNGARQPITGGLEVSSGPGIGVSVFFGTGSYFQSGDHDTSPGQDVQSLYSIWDNGTVVPVGFRTDPDAVLQPQFLNSEQAGTPATRKSTSNAVNYLTQRGWYLDLQVGTDAAAAVGERFIGTPRLQNGKVFFTTYVPLGNSCTPGGRNWLFSFQALTGAAALSQVSLNPAGNPAACEGADCSGIAISEGAPIRDTSVLIPPPAALPGLAGGCVPGTPGCEPPDDPDDVYQRCTIVVRASGAPPLYLPRPCGRQSWRQVR